MRIFRALRRPSPGADLLDDDPKRPKLELGTRVSVIVGAHNKTPRSGRIRDRVWHHKHRCWHYYLEENGKKVKKSYQRLDLEVLSQDPTSEGLG